MKLRSQTPILATLLFVLAVGYSFAERVVVIPLMEETDVSDLVTRIEALETKLACVGELSDAGNFFLNDCNVNIAAGDGNVYIKTATGSVSIASEAMDVSIKAPKGDISLASGIQLDIGSDGGNVGIAAKTGSISLKANTGKVNSEAAQSSEIKVGGTTLKLNPTKATLNSVQAEIISSAQAIIKSPLTQVEGTSQLGLQGAMILGGTQPVARLGDPVQVTGANAGGPFVAVGAIQAGNPTVLF